MNKKTTGRINFLGLLRNKISQADIRIIEDAYTLAKYGHRNQKRDEGERYFEHPKNVALILINELKICEKDLIILALLHDVLEDTFILSRNGVERLFGKRVIIGLDYLTKTGSRDEYIEKLENCKDIGIIIVKYADRLHNLRTTQGILKEKKDRVFAETKQKYLPMINAFIEQAEKKERKSLIYLRTKITEIITN